MNALAIKKRMPVRAETPKNAQMVQVVSKNDERLEQVTGEMADRKTMLRNKMISNVQNRRE